jgi:hypothetical protein
VKNGYYLLLLTKASSKHIQYITISISISIMSMTSDNPIESVVMKNSSENTRKPFSNKAVLSINQELLDSIATGDYDVYKDLCADDLSCFEPESSGMFVEGLDFHKYYFDLGSKMDKPMIIPKNITMSNPHIRWLGQEAVVVSYTRVDQTLTEGGQPITETMSETRIWEVRDSALVHVHFHKSKA